MSPSSAAIDPRIEQARAHHRAGRAAEAQALCEAVLETAPDDLAALNLLGLLLLQAGQHDRAAPVLRRVVALDPSAWRAFGLLGVALRRREPRAALEAYDRALALNPRDAANQNNRGNVLLDLGRHAEAAAAFEAAVALRPDYAVAMINRARALVALGRPQEALEAAEAGRALGLDDASARLAWAGSLMGLERWDEALAAYDSALERDPRSAAGHHGRGQALLELDFLKPVAPETNRAALASYDRALELDPHAAETRWSRALTRLRLGLLAEGWDDYEERWQAHSFVSRSAGLVLPSLRGRLAHRAEREHLAGKRVLLVSEQGIGDVLMFASMIPDLQALAGGVALICETRLHRLFGNSFPGLELVAPGAPAPPHDLVLAIGSLGRLFRLTPADFPGRPYLSPSEPARRAWAERLGPRRGRLRIGVSWRGGLASTGRSARSLELAQLAPLLDLPDCEFVSLQYGEVAEELAQVNAGRGIPIVAPAPDTVSDFDDLAAAVLAMDLVVSVQTALVHLSGAVGQRCLVMVPRRPEWRYGLSGEAMPWYGSVRLFRQGHEGDWNRVIARVADEIRRA
ncbi:tetratricopeptide repeat protein [Phenylobacterium sp.]|uniref:CHAT domain-containing protein n=1 Tax=Phenylobacterium sp. TaxID=1871053 RepID=UPI0035B4A3A0